jgi:hypothetical protein
MKGDGDLSPWLEELDASVGQLSAKNSGLKLPPRWHIRYERSLRENRDASRLVRDVLPKCAAARLARFVMLTVGTTVERDLVELKRRRGEQLKKIIASAAKKDRSIQKSQEAQEFNRKAGRAFDTRREGLAEYCFPTLIMRRYLQFRSGVLPTARELATLLNAGLAALGRPVHLRGVDYDLLRRNLKNYEKKHPHEFATGERCAQIIELTPLAPRSTAPR